MTLHMTDLEARAEIRLPIDAPASRPFSFYRDGFKRVFETALILLSGVFSLPLIIILAAMVACDGHNPFYSQVRVGKNGRHFRMWKLRTMVPNADALLHDHLASDPAARAEWNATQKLKNDPRITRVGQFLRKSSADELPQLLNVLLGSMALVGPRPMMVDQQSLYPGNAYYNLRPGITGMWQISDRNECDFVGRVRHDNAYDEQISLKTDVGILAKTVGVVLRCTGY